MARVVHRTPAPRRATAGSIPEEQARSMIVLAKAGITRSAICKQLYGSSGGRDYAKIKAVLDEAGL